MRLVQVSIIVGLVLAFGSTAALAFGSFSGCETCHTTFGGFGTATHDLHVDFVNACTYCHTSVGDTPSTGSSGMDPENSCSGCHVLNGTVGHHRITEASDCSPCHDGVVADGSEADLPPYYGTAATSLQWSCFDGIDNDGDNLYDGGDNDCDSVPTLDRSWSVIKKVYGD